MNRLLAYFITCTLAMTATAEEQALPLALKMQLDLVTLHVSLDTAKMQTDCWLMKCSEYVGTKATAKLATDVQVQRAAFIKSVKDQIEYRKSSPAVADAFKAVLETGLEFFDSLAPQSGEPQSRYDARLGEIKQRFTSKLAKVNAEIELAK